MKHKYGFLLCILAVSCLSALCDDNTQKPVLNSYYSSGKVSLGINKIPWETFNVSLKWWDNDKSGSELLFSSYFSSDSELRLILSPDRYSWFERSEIKEIPNMFFVKGMGIGANISRYTNPSKTTLYVKVSFPLGIEHFCFKDIPNFSYSIEANFYISGSYTFDVEGSFKEIYVAAGVTPQFFIRWYF